jgi:hypothetical protein
MAGVMIASERQVTVRRGRMAPQVYATLRTAVLHHNQLRDESGKGASQWPTWFVDCEGETYHWGNGETQGSDDVTRRLSDEALLFRLTERVARDGWVTTARALNVRHVAYLRQILGGERPLSDAVRTALLAEVAK